MPDPIIDAVKAKIIDRHQGDREQLEVVFSSSNRILVEAPAGYGKTNAMVSKIAYLIATHQIPNPKRLLALTFSVNAAYKIKKDVSRQIPELLDGTGINVNVNDKVFVSNYHGFCRNILKKYGYKFHSSLPNIDKLQSVDDNDTKRLMQSVDGLTYTDANFMSDYNVELKNVNVRFLKDNFSRYNEVVIREVLPREIIPYNAILTLAIKLFIDYPKILEFYQRYFTTILVDEYQDTNILSYWLIERLINDHSKVILLGDSLQRIYGFIGAVPDLLAISKEKFGLTKIQLRKNYRFASNLQMLQLDANIRKNAENPENPAITENAIIELDLASDQNTEALNVVKKSISLIQKSQGSKVAILIKQRGPNINQIIKTFEHNDIPYFFGLFTDEDVDYIHFHRKCLFEFIDLIKIKDRITKKLSITHVQKIRDSFDGVIDSFADALINLLEIFWNKVFSDYSFLSNEEKITLIKETFEHNSLKQYIEFVDANIIVSTVHAAKGLEWDFVILPDMEQDLFPNWIGLCNSCTCKEDCQLVINEKNIQKFLEELSVFYVAVTRTRKQVYFTASQQQLDKYGRQWPKGVSCFLKLPGIEWNDMNVV